MWNDLSSYLSRFKTIQVPHGAIKQAVSKAILEECGQRVYKEDISVKKGVVTITSSSSLKSELFIKKKALLTKVREKLPRSEVVSDIR